MRELVVKKLKQLIDGNIEYISQQRKLILQVPTRTENIADIPQRLMKSFWFSVFPALAGASFSFLFTTKKPRFCEVIFL